MYQEKNSAEQLNGKIEEQFNSELKEQVQEIHPGAQIKNKTR